jgi:ankyrin repeat protein
MRSVSPDELLELKERMKRQMERQRALVKEMEQINTDLIQEIEAISGASAPNDPRAVSVRAGRPSKLALIKAVESGDLGMVRNLLASGVDPNTHTQAREPILIIAAAGRIPEIVRELLKSNARVDEKDDTGSTALIICARDEDIEIVKELVKFGADVNAKDLGGDTPLTNAACWGSGLVVKYLIAQGADPGIADGAGIGAEALARQHGHDAIAEMLGNLTRKRPRIKSLQKSQ